MTRRRTLGIFIGSCATLALVPVLVMKTPVLLADLRDEPPGSEADADTTLAEVAAHHGSPRAWRAEAPVHLELRGRVHFYPARLAFGVGEHEVRVGLTFEPGLSGAISYVIDDGSGPQRGSHAWTRDPDPTGLLVESLRHLFTLPLTAAEVPIRRGLTTRAWREGEFQRVFETWKDLEPRMDVDQIILWVRDGRVERFDTTGRSIAPFIAARVEYQGERALGEFRLPRSARVFDSAPDGRLVHEWELLSVEPAAAGASARPRITPPG